MKKIKTLPILIMMLSCISGFAQQKYWVSFSNKTTTSFNPYSFFDAKTIENRKLAGLPLSDWYDLPVDETYINKVSAIADSTGYASRWLNGMAVYATTNEYKRIKSLSFVTDVMPMGIIAVPAMVEKKTEKEKPKNKDPENKVCEQIYGLQGEEFAYHHITGKGIRIAVLDIGFVNADKHPAFEYLRSHKGILLTYDFLHKKENVFNYGGHGTAVLSCIAGQYEGFKMGLAPDAEFLLARTERETSEFKDEEDAWVAAAEWAEQHGAQIISSSLGYTYQRYFYKDMNGRTSVAARGAAAAARKGILVCIAAGNDGMNQWKFISTPADCDSILTVGGYDPKSRFHINFSSVGPTSDKRLKPNVVAVGTAWVALPKKFGYESGTSFSTPLMAGFVACVWQINKGKTNMEILHLIESTGSLYPYFDYAHGYGIPQAGYLFNKRPAQDSTFNILEKDYDFWVKIKPGYFKDSFQIHNTLKNKYLYTKLSDPDGNIKIYNVIKIEREEFSLSSISNYIKEIRKEGTGAGNFPEGWSLSADFDGYIINYKL
jgi:serine protease AprX